MRSRSEIRKEVTKRILAELIRDAWDEEAATEEDIGTFANPVLLAEYLIKLGVTLTEEGQAE